VQVDGIALLATDFAAGDVDAVIDQQFENVAQDADTVLAMDFDTHGGFSALVIGLLRQEYVTRRRIVSRRTARNPAKRNLSITPHPAFAG
jgi:hypothetical protein